MDSEQRYLNRTIESCCFDNIEFSYVSAEILLTLLPLVLIRITKSISPV